MSRCWGPGASFGGSGASSCIQPALASLVWGKFSLILQSDCHRPGLRLGLLLCTTELQDGVETSNLNPRLLLLTSGQEPRGCGGLG